MPLIDPPATYHTGLFQLRPALGGWQWRTRPHGQPWGLWEFKFGREAGVRARVQAELGEGWTEVPYTKESREEA
jgi:hypothetical protein